MKLVWKILIGICIVLLLVFVIGVAYEMGIQEGNSQEVQGAFNLENKEGPKIRENITYERDYWNLNEIPNIKIEAEENATISYEETSTSFPCYENEHNLNPIIIEKYERFKLGYYCYYTSTNDGLIILTPKGFINWYRQTYEEPLKATIYYGFDEYGANYNSEEFEIS